MQESRLAGFVLNEKTSRIEFVDLLRGIAVIIMVFGHSIDAVLSPESRQTALFALYDAARGFTGPVFLFVAGLAFSIATEKRWENYLSFTPFLRKRLGKVLLLFVLGYALHAPFFSLTKILEGITAQELTRFLQVDVLHCVAASMLILHCGVLIFRTPRRFATGIGVLSFLMVVSGPWIWSIDFAPLFSPVVAPYFNQYHLSIFPLFPYAAYMLSGAVVGHFYLTARRTGADQMFFQRISVVALGTGAVAVVLEVIPVVMLPEHDFWKVGPGLFVMRMSIVMLVASAVYYWARLPDHIRTQVNVLGQASLLVYVVHLLIAYGSAANAGLAQRIGRTLEFPQSFALAAGVLLVMVALVHVWNYLRTHHAVPSKVVRVAIASSLLLFFIAKPY